VPVALAEQLGLEGTTAASAAVAAYHQDELQETALEASAGPGEDIPDDGDPF
jgi:hypothetical protein